VKLFLSIFYTSSVNLSVDSFPSRGSQGNKEYIFIRWEAKVIRNISSSDGKPRYKEYISIRWEAEI